MKGNQIAQEKNSDAIAIKINGVIKDLSSDVPKDAQIELITADSPEGLHVLRHSSAHQLAQAITELYPEAKLTIGPVVEEGFYYDVDFGGKTLSPEDLKDIENKMYDIAKRKLDITRVEISKEEAKELFKGNQYKQELIEEYGEGTLSIYKQGEFADLCKGPHVPNTKVLKNYKLTKISGSYWRADAKNTPLQRVYGISFATKEELKAWMQLQEEAKKRDHRKLGKELDLYSFQEEAPGMPFFHHKGAFIWQNLVSYMTQLLQERDYELVKTPIIMNTSVWKTSGHWDHYQDNMYFTKIDSADYGVKPMNCPGHIIIYKNKRYSYRDLPLRMGEFGLVHRHELSGVLSGLFRVRAFTQDDAHVYCTLDQVHHEVDELLKLVDIVYSTFNFTYNIELSTRPEKAMGEKAIWDEAESILKKVLDASKKPYKINEGDGAFYGPKIDFHLKDAIGRTWQCGTIQLDFQMPEKFDLTYESKDNERKRVIMIHRAILGSVERFLGILVEHYAGKFPSWLAPEQVRIMTVADAHKAHAQKLKEQLEQEGLRVHIDARPESIPKKVREAQMHKIPAMITIGDKEQEQNTLALRTLDNKVAQDISVDAFVKKFQENIQRKDQDFTW